MMFHNLVLSEIFKHTKKMVVGLVFGSTGSTGTTLYSLEKTPKKRGASFYWKI